MFRKALQEASEGKKIGTDWRDDAHWPHCMDYLVKVNIPHFFLPFKLFRSNSETEAYALQTILCFADDTIERPLRKQDGADLIDGSNAVRHCRPAKPLYDLYAKKGL